MRLTDGGVGLHAGFIPGYPASHGCVRLPMGMAKELFQHVEPGTPVEITSNTMADATTLPRSLRSWPKTNLPTSNLRHTALTTKSITVSFPLGLFGNAR